MPALPDNTADAASELRSLTALALAAASADRPPVDAADLHEGIVAALLRIHALSLIVDEDARARG